MNLETKSKQYEINVLDELEANHTNVDREKYNLDYNVDGCGCMGCGCFKSAWTIVLSPAGIAAGMAAYVAASVL